MFPILPYLKVCYIPAEIASKGTERYVEVGTLLQKQEDDYRTAELALLLLLL